MYRTGLALVILLFSLRPSSAQDGPRDTIALVQQFHREYDYKNSLSLIRNFYQDHPENVYGHILYAQTMYHLGQYDTFQRIYDQALLWFPGEGLIRLDYGIKLVESGALDKALPLLDRYLEEEPTSTSARYARARALFWKGYYERALKDCREILQYETSHPEAVDLYRQLKDIMGTNAEFGIDHITDDQPLQRTESHLAMSSYVRPWFSYTVKANAWFFDTPEEAFNTLWLRAGGIFTFNKNRTRIELTGGAARTPSEDITPLVSLEISQRLSRQFDLEISGSHEPYLYTIASLTEFTPQLNTGAALNWHSPGGWLGRVEANSQHFYEDDNRLYNTGAWLMTAPLKMSVVDFRLGYGFQYSTTDSDRFAADQSLEEILANWTGPDTHIDGSYQPYFTPRKMQIHSVVGAVEIRPRDRWTIGIDVSTGFHARTQQPYLFLDTDGNGADYINKQFYTERFVPILGNAAVTWQINDGTRIKMRYTYHNTIFYESHTAGIILNTRFFNEKKAL